MEVLFGQITTEQKIWDLLDPLSTSTMVFGTSLGPAIVGMLLDFGHNYNSILLGMCILAIFASISLAITMKHTPKLISNNIKKGV